MDVYSPDCHANKRPTITTASHVVFNPKHITLGFCCCFLATISGKQLVVWSTLIQKLSYHINRNQLPHQPRRFCCQAEVNFYSPQQTQSWRVETCWSGSTANYTHEWTRSIFWDYTSTRIKDRIKNFFDSTCSCTTLFRIKQSTNLDAHTHTHTHTHTRTCTYAQSTYIHTHTHKQR